MKVLWNMNQLSFAAIGGFIGWFLGGCDGLLYALIAFIVIDYITGVMCAIENHELSSEIGFHGIFRKVLIFMLVGIANIVDVQVIGTGSVLRAAVCFSSPPLFLICLSTFLSCSGIGSPSVAAFSKMESPSLEM